MSTWPGRLAADPKALDQELTTIVPESGQGFNPSDVLGFLATAGAGWASHRCARPMGRPLLVQTARSCRQGRCRARSTRCWILATSSAGSRISHCWWRMSRDGFIPCWRLATPVLLPSGQHPAANPEACVADRIFLAACRPCPRGDPSREPREYLPSVLPHVCAARPRKPGLKAARNLPSGSVAGSGAGRGNVASGWTGDPARPPTSA